MKSVMFLSRSHYVDEAKQGVSKTYVISLSQGQQKTKTEIIK